MIEACHADLQQKLRFLLSNPKTSGRSLSIIAARNGVCAAASWIIPRTCHRSRSVVIGPSVGSAEARTRERYHRSRAAEQRDEP